MVKLIESLTNAFGPSGFEEDVVSAIKGYVDDLNMTVDKMHNVYLSLKSNTGNRPVIMLDAHLDEVGFMVQSIQANGLIRIATLGGWVNTNIPAHTVRIKTQSGTYVKGIVASKPPHFMTDQEKAAPIELENLLIDLGVTCREDVHDLFGVQVGDPIAPDVTFEFNDKNGILFGKAFDNRIGCASVVETMRRLNTLENLPFDVIGALASQEEVGTRGAYVTSQIVQPDYAIVFEGSPADDLYYDSYTAQCVLKNGVQIRHLDSSYVSHRGFIDFAKSIATEKGIKVQSAVRRKGGTNAGRIHMQGKAVPVLVLGVPSRYVHTHYNYSALEDVESAVSLAVEVIKSLNLDALERQY